MMVEHNATKRGPPSPSLTNEMNFSLDKLTSGCRRMKPDFHLSKRKVPGSLDLTPAKTRSSASVTGVLPRSQASMTATMACSSFGLKIERLSPRAEAAAAGETMASGDEGEAGSTALRRRYRRRKASGVMLPLPSSTWAAALALSSFSSPSRRISYRFATSKNSVRDICFDLVGCPSRMGCFGVLGDFEERVGGISAERSLVYS